MFILIDHQAVVGAVRCVFITIFEACDDVLQRGLVSEVPVGLLRCPAVEVALVERRIGRVVLDPPLEGFDPLIDDAGC